MNEQLRFPLDCSYRVVAEDLDGMQFVIETVLQQLGVDSPVEKGARSAKGNYITYRITVRVHSLEQMNQIDAELRNIQGVKMVL